MPLFAVTLTYSDDTDRRLEVRPSHREYLLSLLEAGKLHEAGPLADDTGGMIILDAADAAEAQALFVNDPYATHGIVTKFEIREWNRLIYR